MRTQGRRFFLAILQLTHRVEDWTRSGMCAAALDLLDDAFVYFGVLCQRERISAPHVPDTDYLPFIKPQAS